MWIEIFRTGTHTSSNGNQISFSVDDLEKIANNYNNQAKEQTNSLAPLVKGHPSNDSPAYGWVERLARRGNFLLAKLSNLTTDIIEDVRNKQFQRISIALTKDFHLKHIGLLGAANPAVDGLAPVSFTEFDENIELEYSHSDDSITNIIHENYQLKEKVLNYERILVSRDLFEFTQNLISNGIISQNQKQSALELLELAYDIDKSSSVEYNLLDKIKSFFKKNNYLPLQKEFATNQTSRKLNEFTEAKNFHYDREKLHNTIVEYMEQNPEIDYQQALNHFIR